MELRTPEIQAHEVTFLQEIGTGAFGKVFRGTCRGKNVAIKVLHNDIRDKETLQDFKKEVAIMSTIFHPNICLFMGACTQPGHFFIVQEFMSGGDVENFLRKNDKVSLYRRMQMARDAALGVRWLHESNPAFVHRDLKTSNLLIDENGKVKVCDFGLAQAKPQSSMLHDEDHAKGTPLWMAPEVMQFAEFNEKADVYSFGIVLWELLTRKPPFDHHKDFRTFRKAVCQKHERPPIPDNTEPLLRNLIEHCWAHDPIQRPSFNQIIHTLDHILVDVVVKDHQGRNFWKQNFLGIDEVQWQDFQVAFVNFYRLPLLNPLQKERIELNLKCLKSLLVLSNVEGTTNPNLQRWGKFLQWFGPLGLTNGAGGTTTGGRGSHGGNIYQEVDDFLNNITAIIKQPWFHGDTTSERACQLLSGKPSGTFMIRFSTTEEGWYTVSQTDGKVIQHNRIQHQPGCPFIIETESYRSLEDLVNSRRLMMPCDGSIYLSLFGEVTSFYPEQM